jgi:hypothetical protein
MHIEVVDNQSRKGVRGMINTIAEAVFLLVVGWVLVRIAQERPEVLTGAAIYFAMWYAWLTR